MSTLSDPFTTTIAPLSTGLIPGEYSVKVTTKTLGTNAESINVYSGVLDGTIESNVVGIQSVFITVLEKIIQNMILTSYILPELPKLGRPVDFVFEADDIMVSFADQEDYLIFRFGTDDVFFVASDQAVQTFDLATGTLPFVFTSSVSGRSYTLTNALTTDIQIDDSTGKNFSQIAGVVTYDGNIFTSSTEADGTLNYIRDSGVSIYTTAGYTVFPGAGTFPASQELLLPAEFVEGPIYDKNSVTIKSSTDLLNYLSTSATFTTSQTNCVTKVCNTLFPTLKAGVKHISDTPNRTAFSNSDGFAGYIALGNIKFEIRIA